MKTKIFPLYDDTQDILRVAHTADYDHLTIGVNDNNVGTVSEQTDLKKGVSYDIGDGNILYIRLLHKYFMFNHLQILVNGEPVENSDTHPEAQFKWVFIAAAIPFLANLLHNASDLAFKSMTISTAIFGINLLLLVIFYRHRTVTILIGIIALYGYKVFGQVIAYRTIADYYGDAAFPFLLYWAFQTLIWLLPTLYMLHEGIAILKNLGAIRHEELPHFVILK